MFETGALLHFTSEEYLKFVFVIELSEVSFFIFSVAIENVKNRMKYTRKISADFFI